MTTPALQPWEQQPSEPNGAFARFCTYLALGQSRTLIEAYRRHASAAQGISQRGRKARKSTKEHVSGGWAETSLRWKWAERADAWDAENGRRAVQMAQHDYAATFRALMRQLLTALEADLRPESYESAVESFATLAAHYAPIEAAT
jgi:hypothetical protein